MQETNLTNQDGMQEKLFLLKLAISDGILFFLQEFVQRETERLKFVTERAGGGKEKERVAVREEKPEVSA